MDTNPIVKQRCIEHLDVFGKFIEDDYLSIISEIGERCKQAVADGYKILLCGNGGSAADAQHLAAELIGRFVKERRSLAAVALTTDTSILTSIANDYSYDTVFERQVEGLGRAGDVLIGISTSGNSENVLRAMKKARDIGMHTIGLTGEDGGKLKSICDLTLTVPSRITARIQEMHILAGHIICELVEEDYD
ncbi:phosphoheptose isomerase [Veillonella montpellierensis DNF00314]|uniref:Phosphoheptose isomerase n=1 Tax=Veillonella montpellierensis DNF00314 TaxID=1401067 RepID=A0A096C015_9FIRM|nr:D-sedoheptulose 7-phosphate isomerase [Veillonella montpellierensis]KGF48322.1 phosphoheptose isomerase [Veillonella montpellierensis DNF00314]